MNAFKEFNKKMQENFKKIVKGKSLFELDFDKEVLWNIYLDSFPAGTNEKYRERREYDCSCCRNFIKHFGGVVVIIDNKIKTIWDFDTESDTFQPVVYAMNNYLMQLEIKDAYLSKVKLIGTPSNHEMLDNGKVVEWNHFFIGLPQENVTTSNLSIPELLGQIRDVRNVFKRSLDEIKPDSVTSVLEIISSNSLYKGSEWQNVLELFRKRQTEYSKTPNCTEEDIYAWQASTEVGPVIGKIRNHSIGTLLINISSGMELDEAVRRYEAIVAPSNYKRPKAIYTKKMLEDAKKTLEENGFLESLERRYANLHDITINNILFSNRNVVKVSALGIFDKMEADVANTVLGPLGKFSKVEEIGIEDFIKNVLPLSSSVELFLENKHAKNLVSLIAPGNDMAKSMFKWNNNFSWAYSGNMTDSDIRKNVEKAGGSVTGALRFSIQWNDGKERNPNDLDATCVEPNGNMISFRSKINRSSLGNLDVDIITPSVGVPAVENITWPDMSKMQKGKYLFYVNNFSERGGRDGFRAEIAFGGEVHHFDCQRTLRAGKDVNVAWVDFDGNKFTIDNILPSTSSAKNYWGLASNQFIPVSVIMNSPNYWDSQDGIGNKHFFFMLKGCINEENPNGFYNEFLNEDLMKHKRVLEALGSKVRVEESQEQLSGVGFSTTQRNEVVVKVTGQTERVLKVKF